MDGFDDLLSPSKRALGDDPFENPFAQHRSGSPDPWASFSPQLEHNPFSTSESTTAVSPFEPEPPSPVSTTSADPLDSAITTEQKEHDPSPPRTPTQFTTFDLKDNPLEDEHQPTPEPLSKPTPTPEVKPLLGPEPTAPQLEAERTPIQETTPLPSTHEPVSPPSSKGFVAFTPTHSPGESEAFPKPISSVISPLDHPGLGGGFGDPFPSISSLGGGALSGGWESQSSSMFVNNASLESSREPSLPDDDDEDNRPVAQSPILKAKEREKEALTNVHLITVPSSPFPSLMSRPSRVHLSIKTLACNPCFR
jgi:sorting nexin-1/2